MSYLWTKKPGSQIKHTTLNATNLFSLLVRFNAVTQGATNNGAIVGREDKNPGLGFDGTAGSKKLKLRWFYTGTDGEWKVTAPAVRLPGWNTVAYSWDGSVASHNPLAVVNGVLATTVRSPSASGSAEGGAQIHMGWANAESVFDGKIGELAIWPGKLFTLAELLEVSYKGPKARPGGLALWWRLGAQLTLDLSGNGRTGVLAATTAGQEPVWNADLGMVAMPVGGGGVVG